MATVCLPAAPSQQVQQRRCESGAGGQAYSLNGTGPTCAVGQHLHHPDQGAGGEPLQAGLRGRPPVFDAETCKQRPTVECAINLRNQHPGVASRYDNFAVPDEATVHVTAINIWLRWGGGLPSDPSDSLES